MTYLFIKAAISGVLIALASEVARKFPGFGALIASLPLVSVIGMMWLWRDTQDTQRLADHAQATLWFVLPSLPMFVLIPVLLRRGVGGSRVARRRLPRRSGNWRVRQFLA